MNRYRITEADKVYAAEFKRNLEAENGTALGCSGFWSQCAADLGLANTCWWFEPFQRWRLGKMPAKRGDPIEIVPGRQFRSLKEAEWTVFKLRWQEHTGETLSL